MAEGAEQTVGITLKVKDKVSKTVRKIAQGVGTLGKVAKKVSKSAASNFMKLSVAVVAANMAVGLAQKVWGGLTYVVGKAVEATRKFRGEGDNLIRQLNKAESASEANAAILGDALLPAYIGISIAIDEVVGKTDNLVYAQREAIAVELVVWAAKLAKILTYSLSRGINLINLGFGGMKLILITLRGVVTGVFGSFLKLVSKAAKGIGWFFTNVSEGVQSVLSWFKKISPVLVKFGIILNGVIGDSIGGAEKWGKFFTSVGNDLDEVAETLLETSVKTGSALYKQTESMYNFQEAILSTGDSVSDLVDEIEKLAIIRAAAIAAALKPTPKDTGSERLTAFTDKLAKWSVKIRKEYQGTFSEATRENIEALDKFSQKLGYFGAEVTQFGGSDMDRLLKKALELKVVSEEMAFDLSLDPTNFVAAMSKAVSVMTASVTEMKGQLSLLESAYTRVADEIEKDFGGAIRSVAAEAFNLFKINEALLDMEEAQVREMARLKLDLNRQVTEGEITAAEMKAQLDQQNHDNRLSMIDAEEAAYQSFYRGLRDQIIAASVEYGIRSAIDMVAQEIVEKKKREAGARTTKAALARLKAELAATLSAEVAKTKIVQKEEAKRQAALAGGGTATVAVEKVKTAAAKGGEAVRSAIGTKAATASINKSAAKGGAEAVSSFAGIPVVGIALGLAAAAVMVAAVTKFMGKWAGGGYVTGGTRGKDSVPGLLMPGEYVLNTDQVEMWKRLSLSMATGPKPLDGAYAGGGFVSRGSGVSDHSGSVGSSPQVNLRFESNQLPNRAETKRWIRSTLSPALKELNQQGMMVGV